MATPTSTAFYATAPPTLLVGIHETSAVAIAKRLGAAAFAANMPRNPVVVPEFMSAMSGLSATDPMVVKIRAAYTEAFDTAKSAA